MSIIRQALKKHKRQSRPPWGKVAPTGDGRGELALKPRLPPNGELALKPRLPPNLASHPSDCEAGARKSRPLWGKGDRVSGGRGELAGYLDCLTINAPTPTTTTQTKPHQIRGAIQPRKRAPPHRALTGPPPTQRGRLNYSPQSMCKNQKPSPSEITNTNRTYI